MLQLAGILLLAVLFTAGLPSDSLAQDETTAIDSSMETDPGVDEAVAIVRDLHEMLIHIMQHSDSLGYQGRYDYITDMVTSRFDTPLIAKVIMSRYWKNMDEEQKAHFIDLFRKLSIATYASRFDGYSGESFVEVSTEELKKGRILIKTELIRPEKDPVKLDYLMHRNEGEWMIISVIANGINDLSLKRAEYATVIKERGFEGLVDDVSQKIADLEKTDGGES